jgi:Family of unknown function (DUF6159)
MDRAVSIPQSSTTVSAPVKTTRDQVSGSRVDNADMKLRRSFALLKAAWGVLSHDKELLWLPVISGICSLIVAASFGVPIFLTSNDTTTSAGSSSFQLGVPGYALIALAYFVLAYVTIFFNTGLVWAANERLDGRDPTLGSALGAARARATLILPWALVSATVSLLIRAVEERAGFLGRIVIGLIGMAWSLVTFLVLPLIVLERVSVGAAIKESAAMFKRTWGENVIGQGGIGLVTLLAILVTLPVAILLFATGITAVIVGAVVLGIIWIVGVMVVTSALGVVFQTALYRYASSGTVPPGFSEDLIAGAFKAKKKRKGLGAGRSDEAPQPA